MKDWLLHYNGFDPSQEPLRESLCTLGNGYFATRGASEESTADGIHYPGTYLAGGYNRLKSDIAGRVIESEDLVNWPNWLRLSFKMEGDENWFKVEETDLLNYEQTLDMQNGLLKREIRFRDQEKRKTSLTSIRLVSMHDPHLASITWRLKPENWSGGVIIRTILDGAVKNEGVSRYKKLSSKHLQVLEKGRAGEDSIYLLVQTTQSRLYMAQASRCRVFRNHSPLTVERMVKETEEDISQEITFEVRENELVEIEKNVSLFCSSDHAISDPLSEAKDHILQSERFEVLARKHHQAWQKIWNRFDIQIESEGDTQLLLRLHIFHLMQTCSEHTIDRDCGVPARGLHGEAYRGHIFWDELFILPFFNLHFPDLTRSLLLYRYRRIGKARNAAIATGFSGAMFPWQSGSDGREENQVLHLNPNSGKWLPDDTYLQRHVNAAIAYNIWCYYNMTQDLHFMRFYGAELFLEITRFLASLTFFNSSMQRFEIKGVVGPDEFHTAYPDLDNPGIDNNAYTNYMTVWVMKHAFKILDELDDFSRKEIREKLSIGDEELDRWKEIGKKMYIPFHDSIISQFDGYAELKELDWEHYTKKYQNVRRLDRILEAEGDSVNRYKASKQGDVLMLFYLFSAEQLTAVFKQLGYDFDPATIPGMVEYYTRRTTDGSTLSRVVRSWVEARSNRECSWHCFDEALNSDFKDVQGGTTPEGIHLGSMAGTVDLVQRCFPGLEVRDNILWINPFLPPEMEKIQFRIFYRSGWLYLIFKRRECTVSYESGVHHHVVVGFEDMSFELKIGEEKRLTKNQ